ncbi:MAG: diguanylate cyclase, partial [Gammaproteobacteria bacterium]|nr:diguanylate cyclase [Gammaproteobacteria bacterium]NIT63073.1 diguanylate cyclase [Gammaproteobacteria bacterium]NIV20032.1 diguanylate cyclase [Gammaproteobacteria bacterium]NIY31653.1 diguanylate cyclase [Gammaproteobacteria bacterium]
GQWLANVARGNWGNSYAERRPVTAIVAERFVNTLWLTAATVLLALVLAVALGVAGAVSDSRFVKSLIEGFAVLGISIPTFWSGTLVILVFAVYLDLIPSGGMATIGRPFSLTDRLWHLLAPAAVLGTLYIAQWSRYLQAGL